MLGKKESYLLVNRRSSILCVTDTIVQEVEGSSPGQLTINRGESASFPMTFALG